MPTNPETLRQIHAPWTPEQVAALNAFQRRGGMHPFTCGADHAGPSPVLVAREGGWHCPGTFRETCGYRQDWAHAFMAAPAPAVVSSPPATDRATVLREAIDVAREEGHRLEAEQGIEAARGARSVAYLLRKLLVKADMPVDWAVVAYRSPGTRALYCVICARQETGWQPLTADALPDGNTACDFCGGRVLAVASRTLGDVVARYVPAVGARQPDTETLIGLIRDFRDPDPCSLDHHGYCQAHAWMCSGSPCPHGRAREVLAAIDAERAAGGAGGVADETGEGRCPACGHTVCDGDGPCGALSGDDFCTCPGAMSGQTTADHITQETP